MKVELTVEQVTLLYVLADAADKDGLPDAGKIADKLLPHVPDYNLGREDRDRKNALKEL